MIVAIGEIQKCKYDEYISLLLSIIFIFFDQIE